MVAPISVSYDVEALRQQEFPLTSNTVYLNHAGISPLPRRTARLMQEGTEQLMLDPAGSFENWFMPRTNTFGETIRALIHADAANEIIGIQNTSIGFNLFAQSYSWQRGQNIVLCDIEFPSNVYPWMSLQTQHGVELRFVSGEAGGLTVDALARAVDANTRLVTVSAIQFFTGHRADLKALGAFCHEHNILFAVDAIQAAGHMSIDVQAMHIDVLSCGGQKSLMGPLGEGFLYIRSSLAETLSPAFLGPLSVTDWHHWLKYHLDYQAGAERFNTGTSNMLGLVGLQESVKMLLDLGIESIDSYVTQLAGYTIDQVKAAGCEVITPASFGPIVTFRAAETDAATDAIVNALRAQRIFVVKHWNNREVAHIRASLHCYNNTTDIDRLVTALKEIKR